MDPDLAKKILDAKDGKHVKRLSKQLRCTPDWDRSEIAINLMKEICIEKFKAGICRDKMYQAFLDKVELIEAVWKPRNGSFWGTGLSKEQTMYTRRDMWPGSNQLGQVLMWVMKHMFDEGDWDTPDYSSDNDQVGHELPVNTDMSVDNQELDGNTEEGEIVNDSGHTEGTVMDNVSESEVKPKSIGNRQTDHKSQSAKADRGKAKIRTASRSKSPRSKQEKRTNSSPNTTAQLPKAFKKEKPVIKESRFKLDDKIK